MKTPRLMLALCGALLLSACGGAGPGDAVEDFYTLVEAGKAQEASQMITGGANALIGQEKIAALLSQATSEISQKGGIDRIEVLDEQVQGNTATVRARITYGNGETQEVSQSLVKIDDHWKITPDMQM